MLKKKLPAVLAALAPLALTPAAASAATAPAAQAPSPAPGPVFTFIPPKVGTLQVVIGATFIGGKMISPGVNVSTPGTSLPPIVWRMPSPS